MRVLTKREVAEVAAHPDVFVTRQWHWRARVKLEKGKVCRSELLNVSVVGFFLSSGLLSFCIWKHGGFLRSEVNFSSGIPS